MIESMSGAFPNRILSTLEIMISMLLPVCARCFRVCSRTSFRIPCPHALNFVPNIALKYTVKQKTCLILISQRKVRVSRFRVRLKFLSRTHTSFPKSGQYSPSFSEHVSHPFLGSDSPSFLKNTRPPQISQSLFSVPPRWLRSAGGSDSHQYGGGTFNGCDPACKISH